MAWSIRFDIFQLYSPDQVVELQFYHKKQEQQIEYFLFLLQNLYIVVLKLQLVDFREKNKNFKLLKVLMFFLSFVIMVCEYNVYNLYVIALQLTGFRCHKIVILAIFLYQCLCIVDQTGSSERTRFYLPPKLALFQKNLGNLMKDMQ